MRERKSVRGSFFDTWKQRRIIAHVRKVFVSCVINASLAGVLQACQMRGAAAKAAFEGRTGEMIALERISNDPYQCTTKPVDIHLIANLEKKIPLEWINTYHTDMKPEFLQYARPLIQSELTPVFIDGLPRHIHL